MAATVEIVTVQPTLPRSVFIQWTVLSTTPGPYSFKVERSGSPEGPWTLVANVTNTITATDTLNTENANLLSASRSLWYRVTLLTDPAVVTAPMNLFGERANDSKQDGKDVQSKIKKRKQLIRRKIIRDETLAFRLFNGVDIAVLKKRHFGVRCTVCYDPLTKMNIRTNCPVCFGTSWTGGYYPPIITLGKVNPSPEQVSLGSDGRSEFNGTIITLLNYPLVEEGDILVERPANTRWIVKTISPSELRRLTVHQVVQAIELPKISPEFKIPV